MRKVILGAAAAAMLAGSSMAQAAPVAMPRAGSPVAEGEELGGDPTIVIAIIAAVVLAVILALMNEENNENLPIST